MELLKRLRVGQDAVLPLWTSDGGSVSYTLRKRRWTHRKKYPYLNEAYTLSVVSNDCYHRPIRCEYHKDAGNPYFWPRFCDRITESDIMRFEKLARINCYTRTWIGDDYDEND